MGMYTLEVGGLGFECVVRGFRGQRSNLHLIFTEDEQQRHSVVLVLRLLGGRNNQEDIPCAQ